LVAVFGEGAAACGGTLANDRGSPDAAPVALEGGPGAVGSLEEGGSEGSEGGVSNEAGIVPPPITPCMGAQCGQIQMLGSAAQGGGIASDGEYVYWLTPTSLERCAVSGCNQMPEQLLNNVNLDASRTWFDTSLLAAGGGFAYWSQSAAVVDLSIAAMSTSTFSMAAAPEAIVSDGKSVYWANSGGNSIQKCPLASACGNPTTVATTPSAPQLLAVDSTTLVWSDLSGNIYSTPIAGGPVLTIAAANWVSALAVFGGRVYWTSDDGCGDYIGVFTCLASAPSTPGIFFNEYASGLVLDPTTEMLYWTNGDAGTVRRCPLGTACLAPVTIAQGVSWPTMMTIDAQNVYFLAETPSSDLGVFETAK
jgi:hypothetical protein